MENFNFGEVVLVSFPFSDFSGTTRRPALVLLDPGDEDIVVARVTSQAVRDSFDVEIVEWQRAGLLLPSVVRLHKLATLEKRSVVRKLGELKMADSTRVLSILNGLWRGL